MPKITRHGGATNAKADSPKMTDAESLASFDESLGDPEPEAKEDESSLGNNSSLSSRPTQTIEQLLGESPR